MIFTFWEGNEMPEYLKMCMETWKFDYVLLNYNNLKDYTDLKVDDNLKRFSLPQIADAVRVHVLRDNGGYWLDTDTIMLSDSLPEENLLGYPETREHTIGFLHTNPNTNMYISWANYQDKVIRDENPSFQWNILGNRFTDSYVKHHKEVTIGDINNRWPETKLPGNEHRWTKYKLLYFKMHKLLSDFYPTDMLMLHNSWTPDYYKKYSREEILNDDCTLSNILKEMNQGGR